MDARIRELERLALQEPNDATKALAYVQALARVQVPEAPALCVRIGCGKPGTDLAYSRRDAAPAKLYCMGHADDTADEGGPEYTAVCPACGCRFGIG